ncbi:MAG TPA: cytochrome c3 family protein [Acidobacteriota bacterium]|nr:cytochrome c3 family protein [Acidobacteriota bacterium]
MDRRAILIPAAALWLAAAATPVRAQSDAGCVTKDCHAEIGTKKWMHGPVGAFICSICHNRVEGKDHEFVMAAEKEELCFNCHETTRDMMLENHLHTPVATGDCVGCHDPHQTDYRFSLKGQAADLCYVCHDRAKFEGASVHGPIAVGDCNACHNPHASAHPNQLVAAPEEICFNCHQEQRGLLEQRHVHPPVADDCTNCHEVHASAAGYLLPSDQPQLCYGCHEDIAAYANVTNRHEPVANGQCDNCHDVHASENPKLFPVPQTELCFSCHTDLEEYVGRQTYLHGPVKQGDCNACHDPHGSNYHRILIQYFPPEFYTPYAEENYALCFECHNRQVALDEHTATLTNFRDGDRNLHFVHVNKQEKGRSCRACHQVHASTQEKHVRTSVPFGKIDWELPVTFTKKGNGGNCVVGCHAPFDYNPSGTE